VRRVARPAAAAAVPAAMAVPTYEPEPESMEWEPEGGQDFLGDDDDVGPVLDTDDEQ
jgi:hypothetical protein